MSSNEIKLNFENVGVFRGNHSFNLKKGLNAVKAPNAKGKTSFTRGLELFLIPASELKGKGYFMNMYATAPDEQLKVELISENNSFLRRFRRPQNSDDLRAVSRDPFPLKGINLAQVCFATPENELINSILYGKSIKDYIEVISGNKSYNAIVKSLEKLLRNYNRQYQKYKDDLIRLDETSRSLNNDLKEKEKNAKELQTLPEVDEEKFLESTEIRNQYFAKKSEKGKLDKIIREEKGQLESLDQQIKDLKIDIKRQVELISDIEKEHPKITQKIEELKDLLDDQNKSKKEIQQELFKIDDQKKSINDNWVKRKKYGEEKCYACDKPLSLKELQDLERKLENTKKDYSQELKKTKRQIEDYKDEINELQIQERELSIQQTNLAKNEKSLSRRELDRDKISKDLETDLIEQKSFQKDIDKLLENVSEDISDIKKKRDKFEDRILILESKIKETKKRIKELEDNTKGAEILTNKIEFLDECVSYLKRRKDEITEKAAEKFNKRINEIYEELGFTDFKEVLIKDDYKIYITREKEGKILSDWSLKALSTSERYTIGITLLIAAKEEYLPDFPLFVIDEIVTSYDDDRIEKLKECIANISDYVVITQLAPESSMEELTIEHIP